MYECVYSKYSKIDMIINILCSFRALYSWNITEPKKNPYAHNFSTKIQFQPEKWTKIQIMSWCYHFAGRTKTKENT